jgi:Dehydrogenases (flavoproteins)
MKESYDVVVIGGGTAGSFFAKRMAEQGYSALVAERLTEANLGKRLEIFHIDKPFFERYGVPEPKPGDEDYVTVFDYGLARSAFDKYEKRTDYPFLVANFTLFNKRMVKWAQGFGAEYSFSTEFKDFIFDENGKISGALLKKGKELVEVKARLVADCSGVSSAARIKLPDGYGVENFKIGDKDKFYVILRYVKLKNEKDYVERPIGWPYYKTWIGSAAEKDTAILGVGANLSYDFAEQCYAEFSKVVKLPEHEPVRIEKGTTPYRRPPYSLVADGFVALGDSAAITKPYSGEGVTAAWVLCDIAADEIGKAMKDGKYPDKSAMWPVNVRYMTTQGADFADLIATLTGAVDCTPEENDFEFKKGIVFESKAMTEMNRNFANKMSVGESLKLGLKVIGGVLGGKIRTATIQSLLKALGSAGALKKHYRNYPASPESFGEWVKKSDELWAKAGNMADNILKLQEKNKKEEKVEAPSK